MNVMWDMEVDDVEVVLLLSNENGDWSLSLSVEVDGLNPGLGGMTAPGDILFNSL
jgi:hypothetical protein